MGYQSFSEGLTETIVQTVGLCDLCNCRKAQKCVQLGHLSQKVNFQPIFLLFSGQESRRDPGFSLLSYLDPQKKIDTPNDRV